MAVESTPITSEALQATVRRLLPSQVGFGSDLEATNLIQPVIDITPSAEGTQLPFALQTSLDSSSSRVGISNATTTLTTESGFYKIILRAVGSAVFNTSNYVALTLIVNGVSTTLFRHVVTQYQNSELNDVIFVPNVSSLTLEASSTAVEAYSTLRKIADVYGNLQNPTNFTFE
jgi:hypothetical protein